MATSPSSLELEELDKLHPSQESSLSTPRIVTPDSKRKRRRASMTSSAGSSSPLSVSSHGSIEHHNFSKEEIHQPMTRQQECRLICASMLGFLMLVVALSLHNPGSDLLSATDLYDLNATSTDTNTNANTSMAGVDSSTISSSSSSSSLRGTHWPSIPENEAGSEQPQEDIFFSEDSTFEELEVPGLSSERSEARASRIEDEDVP